MNPSALFFLVSFLCLSGEVWAQNNGHLAKFWSRSSGLPHTSIAEIERTSDGYLWLGTPSGLARFDGVRFTPIGIAEGAEGFRILELLDDGKEGLWIATYGGGLGHWSKGRMKNFTSQDGLASTQVIALATMDDELWVGTTEGLQCFREGQFHRFGANVGLPEREVSDIALSDSGGLWISFVTGGIFFLNEEKSVSLVGPPGYEELQSQTIFTDRSGSLWISVGNGHVLKYEDGKWTDYGSESGLPFSVVHCFHESDRGLLWVGTRENGLYHLSGDRFEPISLDGIGSRDSIQSIESSPNGTMWIGTRSSGLCRLTEKKVRFLEARYEGRRARVKGFARLGEDDFWIATYGTSILRGGFERPQPLEAKPDLLGYTYPMSVIERRNGTVCVGGIQSLYQTHVDGTPVPTPKSQYDVTSLYEDALETLWIGTRQGLLLKWAPGVENFEEVEQFTAPISCLVPMSDSGLWIGTRGAGFALWENGRVTRWSKGNGLPNNVVPSLYWDQDKVLWIGTEGGGLAWLEDGKIHSCGGSETLGSNFITQIQEDANGNLWLGSFSGVTRVAKNELRSATKNKSANPKVLLLNEDDGLTSVECIGSVSPASLRDPENGKLYFATHGGIVEIDPKNFTEKQSPPSIHVEELRVDGRPQPIEGNLSVVLSPKPKLLAIRYTALGDQRPEQVQFRYRLNGLSKEWTHAGTERRVTFPSLPPGHYSFEVSATGVGSDWSPTSSPLTFSVRPNFWQSRWTQGFALLGLLVTGVIVTISLMRVKVRLAEDKLKLAHAETEAHILEKKTAQLTQLASLGNLSASLAHELSQPLTAILSNAQAGLRFLATGNQSIEEIKQIFGDIVADDQRAQQVIHRVKNLRKRGALEWLEVDCNSLIDDLVRTMSLTLKPSKVVITTQLSQDIPMVMGDRIELQQVLINLIQNAAEAMAGETTPSPTVTISTRSRKNEVLVSVSDCGNGVETGKEKDVFQTYYTNKEGGLGLGLSLSRTIILAHHGRIWVEKSPEGGARFTFSLPVARNSEKT